MKTDRVNLCTAQCEHQKQQQAARIAELEKQRDAAIQQARVHATEADTQAAIVRDVYRLITAAKGEPGDWHGAEPVRAALAQMQSERDAALARVKVLEGIGRALLEVVDWMSGFDDFCPGGQAHKGWLAEQQTLTAARAALADDSEKGKKP